MNTLIILIFLAAGLSLIGVGYITLEKWRYAPLIILAIGDGLLCSCLVFPMAEVLYAS